MKKSQTVIIGAGQAGLAMSHSLRDRQHDHVVLERGRIAQRWSERWDSLRLLTPNWMSRLPGYRYTGSDPNGYMGRSEVIEFLRGYARNFDAPVEEETMVLSVAPDEQSWRVDTDQGSWQAANVVVATGHSDLPLVPDMANQLPAGVHQVSSSDYRNPDQLEEGGVLVVGASATGVQLADEIQASGRPVFLSVGRHTRLPRLYRGRDILYWLDRMGSLQRPLSSMQSREDAQSEPSLQLVGRDSWEDIDLAVLQDRGVRLTGRLLGFGANRALFAKDLMLTTTKAEMQLRQVLERIERHIATHDLEASLPPAESIEPVVITDSPARIDLAQAGIRTVLWATGYRRSYPWLKAPVFDDSGEIRNHRGRTPARGLYVLGLEFMIRRNSAMIDGVGRDARELAELITSEPRPFREVPA